MTNAFALFFNRLATNLLLVATFLIAANNRADAALGPQLPDAISSNPASFQGTVVGRNGQPVKRFEAVIKIVRRNHRSATAKTIAVWKSQGNDGNFKKQLSTTDQTRFAQAVQLEKNIRHIEPTIVLSISAAGFIPSNLRLPAKPFDGQFPVCKLREAIKVVGRFKVPAGSHNELPITGNVNAIEKLGVLPSANQYEQRFNQTVALTENGNFEMWAPKSSDLFFTVQTNASAPWTHQIIASSTSSNSSADQPIVDMGEHLLTPGASVKGIVFDRDNSPVVGQVVQLYQSRSEVPFADTSIRSCVATNSLGQFELPPFTGKVEISLVDEGISIDGQRITTTGATLAATPIDLTLELNGNVNFLEVREAKRHKAHATVEMPANISTSQIAIKLWRPQDKTNARWLPINIDGTCNFEVVEGTSYRMSFFDELNKREYRAFIDNSTNQGHAALFSDSPATPKRTFKIEPFSSNIGPIRFKILKRQ